MKSDTIIIIIIVLCGCASVIVGSLYAAGVIGGSPAPSPKAPGPSPGPKPKTPGPSPSPARTPGPSAYVGPSYAPAPSQPPPPPPPPPSSPPSIWINPPPPPPPPPPPITCPPGQFRTSPTTCQTCSQCPVGSALTGACFGDSDTTCAGCGIGLHVVNNVCVDCPPGYTSYGGDCIQAAAGGYRGACTTDSNCTEPGEICCMGTCGDASYCNSRCPSDKIFYNGTKTCITWGEYNSIVAAMHPYRNYADGTACSNSNDCSSGFCNAWKNGGVCSGPQAGAGEPCEAWYDCDQSDGLTCSSGKRCWRPSSD